MDTQAVEIIETEVRLEEAWSLNCARLRQRISVALLPYEEQYDILPELEFELSAGRLKPDVAILPRLTYNWGADIIRYLNPPITAIEILSPTQSFDYLVSKIRNQYFSSGVQSAWLLLPAVRSIYLFAPGQPDTAAYSGTLRDPATQIEVALDAIFR